MHRNYINSLNVCPTTIARNKDRLSAEGHVPDYRLVLQ